VNAGKSTLYNALLGREAAIVTDIAGTTRDVLCETTSLGGVTLRLFDTAGLRETEDVVERIGVARSRQAMEEAELILAVLDGSAPLTEEGRELLAELKKSAATVVVILNKSDKGAALHEPLEDLPYVIALSAEKGDIEALSALLRSLYLSDGINLKEDAVVANARQHAALARAEALLEASVQALVQDVPLDAAVVDAELAVGALGEVDGHAVSEDVVDRIFSHFCVGK
jgi:tRNA modification GTPase